MYRHFCYIPYSVASSKRNFCRFFEILCSQSYNLKTFFHFKCKQLLSLLLFFEVVAWGWSGCGHSCFIPNIQEKHSINDQQAFMLTADYAYIPFIRLKKFYTITAFWIFIMNGFWISSNVFSASIDMMKWCFLFSQSLH